MINISGVGRGWFFKSVKTNFRVCTTALSLTLMLLKIGSWSSVPDLAKGACDTPQNPSQNWKCLSVEDVLVGSIYWNPGSLPVNGWTIYGCSFWFICFIIKWHSIFLVVLILIILFFWKLIEPLKSITGLLKYYGCIFCMNTWFLVMFEIYIG